jgi:hypothetical protein
VRLLRDAKMAPKRGPKYKKPAAVSRDGLFKSIIVMR